MIRFLLRLVGVFIETALLLALMAVCAFELPRLHSAYILYLASQNVVKISSVSREGSGSGWLYYSKGQQLVVTNKHVCAMQQRDASRAPFLVVERPDGGEYKARIVYRSSSYDICILRLPSKISSLSLGYEWYIQQEHAVIGHPGGRPLTLSLGRIIKYMPIELTDELLQSDKQRRLCMAHKGAHIEERVNLLGEHFFYCIRVYDSVWSTAPIRPGSSGSPVLNFWGRVIGMVFASDSEGNCYFIPIEQIRSVLKKAGYL